MCPGVGVGPKNAKGMVFIWSESGIRGWWFEISHVVLNLLEFVVK